MRKVLELFRTIRSDPVSALRVMRWRTSGIGKILEWNFPYYSLEPHPTSLHLALDDNTWLAAAWSLASFFHVSRQNWTLFIHEQGKLSDEAVDWFSEAFPNCVVVDREDADSEMEYHLRNHPRCRSLRANEPHLRHLFDAARYATGRKFLVMRIPTLFFSYPADLIACASEKADCCWFIKGMNELPEVLVEELAARFGTHPWPRLDTSLALVSQSAFSPDLCESALAIPLVADSAPETLASALTGICAARAGRGGLWGPEYNTQNRPVIEEQLVCRHYPGGPGDPRFMAGCERVALKLLPDPDG